MTCTLDACRVCTGCAHSNHGACRTTVLCPTTGAVSRCSCCGGYGVEEVQQAQRQAHADRQAARQRVLVKRAATRAR